MMTTPQIVAKLRALQARADSRAKELVPQRWMRPSTTHSFEGASNAWEQASAMLRTLADEIEAANIPQVTPAKAAAAYREVEEQSGNVEEGGVDLLDFCLQAMAEGRAYSPQITLGMVRLSECGRLQNLFNEMLSKSTRTEEAS